MGLGKAQAPIEPLRRILHLHGRLQGLDGSSAFEDGNDGSAGVGRLRVLIVEDEFFISLDTQNLLQALGHDVVGIAVTAEEAVQLAGRDRPDVVLMDIRLIGPRDGIAAAAEIRANFGIGSIFVTANTDADTQARALATEPLGFSGSRSPSSG
jgi:CheY-like chemotaxis protein